jgi:hypothetical protein
MSGYKHNGAALIAAQIGIFALWFLAISGVSAADIGFDRRSGAISCNFYIIGDIVPGDSEAFRDSVLKAFEAGCSPDLLDIFSNGGDLQAAINIGRQVSVLTMYTRAPEAGGYRAARAWGCNIKGTVVSIYDQTTKRGDPNCICASACFFVWAGGAKRLGNVVIIHRPYFDAKIYSGLSVSEARERFQNLTRAAREYLLSVDVPDAMIARMMAISSRAGSFLQEQEIRELRMRRFYDELLIANCGVSETEVEAAADEATKGIQGKTAMEYFVRRLEASKAYLSCWSKARQKILEQAKSEYLARYGEGGVKKKPH